MNVSATLIKILAPAGHACQAASAEQKPQRRAALYVGSKKAPEVRFSGAFSFYMLFFSNAA